MSGRSIRSTFNASVVKGLLGIGAGAGALGATATRVFFETDIPTTASAGLVAGLTMSGALALLHHTLEG